MPPQKRRCASCRYFQSNQLSSKNGWCVHPDRQTSSDVRILVRTDELACRNSWGSDMWVSATGEPMPSSPDANDTTQLPIPIQRRDDEVTSVVHRDALSTRRIETRSGDDVERDDMLVHEASLFPERLSFPAATNDAVNAGAVADQEERAHVLARGGTSSAIQHARDRMLGRRLSRATPPTDGTRPNDVAPPQTPRPTAEPEEADSTPVNATAPSSPVQHKSDAAEDSETPVESPIRTATPRAFGRRFGAAPADDESADLSGHHDPYNSIPERDPSFELPLVQPARQPEEPLRTSSAAESDNGMTVYDAVLQRAREFRESTGRELPVFRDDEAAAERRARRRVQTIPGQTHAASVATQAPAISASPAPAASAAMPKRAEREVAPSTARPATRPTPHETPRVHAAPRMGISLADLKQQRPADRLATPAHRDHPERPPQVGVRRSDLRKLAAEPTPPGASPRDVRRDSHGDQAAPATDDIIITPATDLIADDVREYDAYEAVEEPQHLLSTTRKRGLGRLSNPWKRDRNRDSRERETLASVREALGPTRDAWDESGIDEEVDDEFADVAIHAAQEFVSDDADFPSPAEPLRQTPQRDDRVNARRVTIEAADSPARDDIVQPQDEPSAPAARSDQQAERRSSAPRTSTAPTRTGSLYRPVHESLLHIDERDTPPQEPASAPSPAQTRRAPGNGATVLRLRADGLDEYDDLSTGWNGNLRRVERQDELYAEDAWDEIYEPEPALQEIAFEPTPPAASPWSFAPAGDLETVEGMASFRGRLFGATSASRGERRPDDDLVVDIPTHAEVPVQAAPSSVRAQPSPVRDSPLRSANYRGDDEGFHHQTTTTGTGEAPVRSPYREERRETGRSQAFVDDAFDLRALLDDGAEDIIPDVSIAPDVPRMCQTCRDFRPSESGERGFCANNWAFPHRQMVNAESLPCKSSIGCWWLPSDAIWMPEDPFTTALPALPDRSHEPAPEHRRRSG